MADQTAYQRICAEACVWCRKGLRFRTDRYGRPYHVEIHPSDHSCDRWMDQEHICTAPTKDAVIERLAGELERVRMEAVKLGHEPECASYNYAGKRCVRCGVEESRPQGLCDGYFDHKWHVTPISPCNCAQSRIQVKP